MLPDPDSCYRAILARDARFDGRFFTGVKTTGIYCRPVCPARPPKPENCTYHPSAAAAQAAGFRPCLRCRPETAPDLGAWRGASNTVSRALALIEAGALDEGSVEQLADRVGVGARQLTRLFRQHLGAAPLAVAQTRRVLLARRLISDTQLEMTEVALASGFGSVRRFNETFQQLYGRPPSALRRKYAPASRGGEARAPGLTLVLPARAPYDWAAMLAFLASHSTPGVEATDAHSHRRTIATDSGPGWIEISPEPKSAGARVDVHLPSLKPLANVIARVRAMFDLAAEPGAIGEHLSRDPALAPLIAARPGLRVPGAWDPFELAARTILGQQVSVAAGTRLAGALVQAFGEPLATPFPAPNLTHLFPTPERLANAPIAELGLMPGARARAISNLAGAVIADPALLRPGRSLEDSVARLTAVAGIGPWTAQYIAIRGLRESDAFMPTDVGLLRAAADPITGARPTPAMLAARAQAWRPWRAYACLHLWTEDGDAAVAPITLTEESRHAA